jgi:rare lipoprotein A
VSVTEASSADQGYWVSPFEELAQEEDALRGETRGSGAVQQQLDPMIETSGGDGSTFEGQPSYDDTSAISTQEYMDLQDPHAQAPDPTFGGPAEGMLASWYGPGFYGSPTASGELFDPYGFTAAHPYLPFGTELLVSYGGNSVLVTVNDRGPFVGGRELDLSEGAAQALGLTQAGVDYVGVSYPAGGSGGYGADPSTSAVDTPYVPANAYDPIDPADGVFTPQGEFDNLYDDLDA